MKYRKRPVVVEAMLLPSIYNIDERLIFDAWIVKVQGERKCRYVGSSLEIPTLEGVMTASAGDYIIQGVEGEIYPCKPDIFEKTYEVV